MMGNYNLQPHLSRVSHLVAFHSEVGLFTRARWTGELRGNQAVSQQVHQEFLPSNAGPEATVQPPVSVGQSSMCSLAVPAAAGAVAAATRLKGSRFYNMSSLLHTSYHAKRVDLVPPMVANMHVVLKLQQSMGGITGLI